MFPRPSIVLALALALLPACGPATPVVIRSDPNQERQERMQIETGEANDAAKNPKVPE